MNQLKSLQKARRTVVTKAFIFYLMFALLKYLFSNLKATSWQRATIFLECVSNIHHNLESVSLFRSAQPLWVRGFPQNPNSMSHFKEEPATLHTSITLKVRTYKKPNQIIKLIRKLHWEFPSLLELKKIKSQSKAIHRISNAVVDHFSCSLIAGVALRWLVVYDEHKWQK